MRPLISAAMTLVLACASNSADDFDANWHQWRGPHADGSSDSADPPVRWGPDQNIRWKVAIPGRGSATPVVWGHQIIILTAIKTDRRRDGVTAPQSPAREQPNGRRRGGFGGPPPSHFYQFVVSSYDRKTGDRLWEKVLVEQVPHEAGHPTNSFASASPVTDGERIFVSFGSRGVFCLDMNGDIKWKHQIGEMQTRARFGEGSSPALHGNTLVIPWDHEGQSFLIALDATTGDEKWNVERDERTTWTTPYITEFGGRTQVVMNGTQVRSYDLATGELIWECGGQATNPIPCPVRIDDDVICMTGYRGYAIYAIPLDATGDVTDSDEISWIRTDAAPYVASPTLYKGRLYFTKSREGIISSVDAKTGGEVIGQKRLPGISSVYASPVAAADRIYFTGRDGTTVVIKHAAELEVIATNKLDEGIDASPVILGKEMFLRGEKHLYCVTSL